MKLSLGATGVTCHTLLTFAQESCTRNFHKCSVLNFVQVYASSREKLARNIGLCSVNDDGDDDERISSITATARTRDSIQSSQWIILNMYTWLWRSDSSVSFAFISTSSSHDDLRVLHAGVHDEAADAKISERPLGASWNAITINAIHHDHTQLQRTPCTQSRRKFTVVCGIKKFMLWNNGILQSFESFLEAE